MTCIVGLVRDGRVWIGADSAGANGWDITVRRDRKAFRRGPFLVGFTSSFRMGQLLQYGLEPPVHPTGMGCHEFMCTRFVDAVRDCLEAGGWRRKKDEREEGGSFLVGYRGRLFQIESDFQVGESTKAYDAVGCGQAHALGAMAALELFESWSSDPEDLVSVALEAASQHSNGVCPPFYVLHDQEVEVAE